MPAADAEPTGRKSIGTKSGLTLLRHKSFPACASE
jgi:hypothetical protein